MRLRRDRDQAADEHQRQAEDRQRGRQQSDTIQDTLQGPSQQEGGPELQAAGHRL